MIIATLEKEKSNPDENGFSESWYFLTLYDENDVQLSKSKPFEPNEEPFHVYDGLMYIWNEGQCLVTLNSINKKFGKKS